MLAAAYLLNQSLVLLLQVTLYLHFLWIAPLQAATVIALLMHAIGPSCLAGMSVFFILMPVQILFGRLFSTLRFASHCWGVDLSFLVRCAGAPSELRPVVPGRRRPS